MHCYIVIPARYHSTRLPAKPLVNIAGESLLSRVVRVGKEAARLLEGLEVSTTLLVATDHEEIRTHADGLGVAVAMTEPECPSGSDRVFAALPASSGPEDVVVNLQGDVPFTPADFLVSITQPFLNEPSLRVCTPAVRLSWGELDELRAQKEVTPFSGTTVVTKENGDALWFSKAVIPTIRKEDLVKRKLDSSPVQRHIGLYAYRKSALKAFCDLPVGRYEKLEGLEQLRFLENGIGIRVVQVGYGDRPQMSGIDSPEDVVRAETLLQQEMS